jgi:hypothetical protein
LGTVVQSLSCMQPMQRPALPSQTGVVELVQSLPDTHCTQ